MSMSAIHWPEGYEPGLTDNFASNEVIVHGLSAARVWPLLVQPDCWPAYYGNAARPAFHDGGGPRLVEGQEFEFETFGFLVQARCTECVVPAAGLPGRLAWHGWVGIPGTEQRLDVHHAWLVEDLDRGRVRILTQETQQGEPARQLRQARPNPMINGHQDWLDGLVAAAGKTA